MAQCSVSLFSLFIRVWSTAFIVLGLALTVAWIGLLGYGTVALTELAFDYYEPAGKTLSELTVETTAPEVRHHIQATNIKDGSQAIIIPCKSSGMAAILSAPKATPRIGRGIPAAHFTPSKCA